MIDHLRVADSWIHVHLSQSSRRATKSFTHGSLVFDLAARTVMFGKLPPVNVPEGIPLEDGITLHFRLVGPDGKLRKEERSGALKPVGKRPGVLRIAGSAKSPSQFTAENGWHICIWKFRAYLRQPGMQLTGAVPEWIKASTRRQNLFWNRLAYLCREARRKCSPLEPDEILAMVREIVLPAIDAFNAELGRSRDKMMHPAQLKVAMPGLDGIWSFIRELRKRVENGRPVPLGLLEKLVDFAQPHQPDYAPLHQFMRSLGAIVEREAQAIGLRDFEKRPVLKAFMSTLRRRQTVRAGWSEGWPQIKRNEGPKSDDWAIHYHCHRAGLDALLLESGAGIPGLSFGPVLHPALTDHPHLTGRAAARALRQARISLAGDGKQRWTFDIAVLQHRPLPAGSHIKEWRLLGQEGKLWLCLVVELRRALPEPGSLVAGLDLGWRQTEAGIRFATLYEPARNTIRELTVDLQMSASDLTRSPFRIDLGPNRWDKRNLLRLFPDWKPGDSIPNAFEGRIRLLSRRSELLSAVKAQLHEHRGERLPAWMTSAGRRGMMKLREELREDPTALRLIDEWLLKDEQLTSLMRMYFRRAQARLEHGRLMVAHDVCQHLKRVGVSRLAVEKSFVAAASRNRGSAAHPALKNSQKYRMFVAPGRFLTVLKETAAKYAIAVEEHDPLNTTRICQYCDCLNPATSKEQCECRNCGRVIYQDQNAAINLSRFRMNPGLAEMARKAKTGGPDQLPLRMQKQLSGAGSGSTTAGSSGTAETER